MDEDWVLMKRGVKKDGLSEEEFEVMVVELKDHAIELDEVDLEEEFVEALEETRSSRMQKRRTCEKENGDGSREGSPQPKLLPRSSPSPSPSRGTTLGGPIVPQKRGNRKQQKLARKKKLTKSMVRSKAQMNQTKRQIQQPAPSSRS